MLKKENSLALGVFDGVHRGHQEILRRADAAVTFHPHPNPHIQWLTTLSERQSLIPQLHIIDFTLELSQLSPEAFVRDLLVPRFAPKHLVVGYDYAFGHRRSGDSDQLRALGETYGFTLEVVPPLSVDGTIPKSSLIRTLLHAGDVDQANHLLGRPYQLNGVVIKGKQLGRQLGFPTANLQLPPEKLVPAPGVYVCPGGVVNIDAQYLVEVHWFDFSSDVYGQTVSVDLLHHLRDERRFDSLDALKAQIQEDASAAKAFLKRFFPNAVFSVL